MVFLWSEVEKGTSEVEKGTSEDKKGTSEVVFIWSEDKKGTSEDDLESKKPLFRESSLRLRRFPN